MQCEICIVFSAFQLEFKKDFRYSEGETQGDRMDAIAQHAERE